MKKVLAVAAAMVLATGMANAQTTLDSFDTVTAVNHPEGSGVFGTFYDAADSAFGTAAESGAGDQLTITDGGFTNGVYIIYEAAVPATGDYTVSLDVISLNEDPANTNGIRDYQVGVEVNGTHRGTNPSTVAAADDAVATLSDSLTLDTGDNSASGSPLLTMTTGQFSASAGDDLLIAFATNVTDYATNSGTWGTSSITFDNLTLNAVASINDWMLLED